MPAEKHNPPAHARPATLGEPHECTNKCRHHEEERWGRMSRSRGRHGRERLAASAGEGVRTRQRTVCCSGRQRRRAPQGWRVTITKERRWPSTNGVRGKGNQSRHLGIHLRRSLVGEGTNVHGRGGGPNEKLSHAKLTSCFARLDTRTQRA